MPPFGVDYECQAHGHLDDTTGAVWRHVRFFPELFFMSEEVVTSYGTSNVLDLAATLFTPKTLKVFCGLKHFTHASIGIVVSR